MPSGPLEAARRLRAELDRRGASGEAVVRIKGERVVLSARLDPLGGVRRRLVGIRAELSRMAAGDHPGHVQSAAGDLVSQIDSILAQFDGAGYGVEVSVHFSTLDPPSLVGEFLERLEGEREEVRRVQRLARSILTYARELIRSGGRGGY